MADTNGKIKYLGMEGVEALLEGLKGEYSPLEHEHDVVIKAENAENATNAEHSSTADEATHAESADSATNAEHANEADHATTADTATKAEQDGNGNVIADTYETKEDAEAKLVEVKDYVDNTIASIESEFYIVNVTKDDSDKFVSDRTFAEITEAYNNQKNVLCILNKDNGSEVMIPLVSISTIMLNFSTNNGLLEETVTFVSFGSISVAERVIQGANNDSLATTNKTIVGAINELKTVNDSSVLTTAQELTDEQKAIARANISKYDWKTFSDSYGTYTYAIDKNYLDYDIAQTVMNTSNNGDISALEDIVSWTSSFASIQISTHPGVNNIQNIISNYNALIDGNAIINGTALYIYRQGSSIKENATSRITIGRATANNSTHCLIVQHDNFYTHITYNFDSNTITNWSSTCNGVTTSLTTPGKAADAKAVGDALALKMDLNAELITIADIDEICGGVTEGSLSQSDIDELMAKLQQ